MIIDFNVEAKKIVSALKTANGYMDCEMVISSNINQHRINGVANATIENHLTQLQKYFNDLIVLNNDPHDCIRYRYVTHLMGTGRLKQLINKK
jgi:hypothetical protein